MNDTLLPRPEETTYATTLLKDINNIEGRRIALIDVSNALLQGGWKYDTDLVIVIRRPTEQELLALTGVAGNA